MRRLGLLAALFAVVVLAACDTDEPTDATDTGITLHDTVNCSNGANLYWTNDMRKLSDDSSPGPWFSAGPGAWVNCTSTTGDLEVTHRVEGLERGTAYETRLTVYAANNNTWHNYDTDGTDYGSNYDQGQTTWTDTAEGDVDAYAAGSIQPGFVAVRAINQANWISTYAHGIGVKNAPSAFTHVVPKEGARSQLIRCRVDARIILPDHSADRVTTGWIRPSDNTLCIARLVNIKTTKFTGARYYVRIYLNNLSHVWLAGYRGASCQFAEYPGDDRDLLRCNKSLDTQPPAVSDP